MSWVEWMGASLEPTTDDGELYLHIGSPDAGHDRQLWHFELMHLIPDKTLPERDMDKDLVLTIDISTLHLHVTDWRQLAHREIVADAAWHEAREYSGEYGRLEEARVRFGTTHMNGKLFSEGGWKHWMAHDFIIRIGARDGHFFSCELDAWMIPEEEYIREEPEAPEALAIFAEGAPNLRMMCRMRFEGGTIQLERVSDPLEEARRRLRKQLQLEDFFEAKVDWNLRRTPDHEDLMRMPGWRSSVNFRTEPYERPAPEKATA